MATDAYGPPETNIPDRFSGRTGADLALGSAGSLTAVISTDLQGRITAWDAGAVQLFGYSAGDALGRPPKFLLPHDADANLPPLFCAGAVPVGAWRGQMRLVAKAGRALMCATKMVPLFDVHRQPLGHTGVFALVGQPTAQASLGAALRAEGPVPGSLAGQHYRSAFESAAAGMAMLSLDGELQQVNKALCRLLGYPRQELLGRSVASLEYPQDPPQARSYLEQFAKGDIDSATREQRFQRKDGTAMWVEVISGLERDAQGTPAFVVLQAQDITERRRVQAQLQRNALAFAKISEAVIVTDRERAIVEWSPRAERMFGYTAEEVLGRTPAFLFDPQETEEIMGEIAEGVAVNGQARGEWPMLSKDGRRLICDSTVMALYDEEDRFLCHVGVHNDITQRKAAEARLRRDALAFSRISEGVIVTDPAYRITEWTREAEQMFGYGAEEALGRPANFLFPANVASDYVSAITAGIETNSTWQGEANIVRKDGSAMTCAVKLAVLRDRNDYAQSIVIVHKDITSEKLAAQDLKDSEHRFRTLFDGAAIGMAVMSPEGIPFAVNQALCNMLGYTTEELMELDLAEISFAEDRPQDERLLRHMRAGHMGMLQLEKRLLHKQGTPVWVQVNASLVLDRDGQPFYVIHQILDISERIAARAEREAYAQELERSNKELDDFAHIVSHDLQEPLRVIENHVAQMRRQDGTTPPADAAAALQAMAGSTSRMRNLIHGLLSYARVASQANAFQPVDLELVLLQVQMDLKARMDELGGRIVAGDLPTLDADPLQMHQLLQNLVGNALKFHRPDVPPVVEVSAERSPGATEQDERIVLRVRDNGIGFDMKYVDKVFGVFQRLHHKGAYEGAGVGMAICRRIAERHGGDITAESTPGVGTTFIVTLPSRQAPAE